MYLFGGHSAGIVTILLWTREFVVGHCEGGKMKYINIGGRYIGDISNRSKRGRQVSIYSN